MAGQISTIPRGWKMTTLGEVAAVETGKNVPTSRQLSKGEYEIVGANGTIGFADSYLVDGEYILTGRVGTIGEVRHKKGKFFPSDNVLYIKANNENENKFVYYLLRTANLKILNVGSTQPLIKQSDLRNLSLHIPPLPEQRAIAAVLSSLDEKIELLREQNKTLEATAQTIFKEWFVNFNFPNAIGKMIDSELGKIPEGWRVGKLGDEFDITIGRTPPRLETEWFSSKPKGKKWISIKDIGNSEMYISNTSEYLTDEAIKKFNIPVIPENTTVLSFKMTVGKLAITTEEMLSNEAIAHLKIKGNSNFSTEFIYLFLKGLDFNSMGSTSSIVTAINSTMIKALEILIPEDQIMRKFNAVIQPIFLKLKNNNSQIQTLSVLRDALLPKLMRGEVRVKGFNN